MNDPHPLESDAGNVTSSRPIDNMIGQRVAKVQETESEPTPTKQQRLEDPPVVTNNTTKIDKKFTLEEKPTSQVSKSVAKLRRIAPKPNSADKKELDKIASEIGPIVKAGKINAVVNTPKSVQTVQKPRSEPIKTPIEENKPEKAPEPVDIEEQITEIITNAESVSSTNSPSLKKPQDNIEPVYSTKSPILALTKSPASYVDTFKDFLQKNTAPTIQYSTNASWYTKKRNRKSNNVMIPITGEMVNQEDNIVKNNTKSKRKTYRKSTRRNRRSRKRSISESSSSDPKEIEDMEKEIEEMDIKIEDTDIKMEPDYEEITIEENDIKSKRKSNTLTNNDNEIIKSPRRNRRSRKRSISEQREEKEIDDMDKQIEDMDIKMEPDYEEITIEPDYEEITIEENDICKIEGYEVMEREDDCNVLILKI